MSFAQLKGIASLQQLGDINTHATLPSHKINPSKSLVGQIQVISALQTEGEVKRKPSILKMLLWSGKYGIILVTFNIPQLLCI